MRVFSSSPSVSARLTPARRPPGAPACACLLYTSVREILGSGTWLGIQIIPKSVPNFTLMTSAPGGFFTFGCLMALVVWFETKTDNKIDRKAGCCAEKGE